MGGLSTDREGKGSIVSEEITVRGRGPSGPAVAPPPAPPLGPLADEVLRSLRVYNEEARLPMAGPGKAPVRPAARFPEPPYLAYSPDSFPHPCERWSFEVLSGEEALWRLEGSGRPEGILAWDGSDRHGRFAARVGPAYRFRFAGVGASEENSVSSDPIELDSLAFREGLGGWRLELSNSILFERGKARLASAAAPYLEEMAARLRSLDPRERAYRWIVHQKDPGSRLARARAAALKGHFSKALVVNPEKVSVEILSWGPRGDVTACLLPPEPGTGLLE